MRTKHIELAGDLLGACSEQVAGIGVTGDEQQCLTFTSAADENWWARSTQWCWYAQCFGELVVRYLVRSVVIAPHLETDLQRLFQAFEAFPHWDHLHAQSHLLPLVP